MYQVQFFRHDYDQISDNITIFAMRETLKMTIIYKQKNYIQDLINNCESMKLEDIFNDDFWNSQSFIINAVDSVDARKSLIYEYVTGKKEVTA